MLTDLCVIMLIAAVTSLIFKLLKQPVVLGYIVAGIIIGPYLVGDSWITNKEYVEDWGEIGVLFLLFAMGLEFSFKKLLQMGSTALIAAGVIVVGMMFTGFMTGRLLGLNEMNSLFLGGMLSMSSTTIVFKALDDMGLRTQKFANVCFSILVVEDLFAIILMVLLKSIASSKEFQGEALALEITKLVAYLVLWFFIGIVILPTFLRVFKKHLSDELLTILSIGLCLGMVLLTINAGFSSALGAFVMGSLLAETIEAERIEGLIQPVKNIFGAIFFVSVGLMINPADLVEYWLPILIITFVVIFGQILFATTGTLLSGQSLKVSIQTGFSLTQIGEFAFIIAALGISAQVMEEKLYPIVVAVSVITTFLTPFIIRLSNPVYRNVEKRLPKSFLLLVNKYASNKTTVTKQAKFTKLFRQSLTRVFVYSVVVLFLFAVFFIYIKPFSHQLLDNTLPQLAVNFLMLFVVLAIVSPFLWSIATYKIKSPEFQELWKGGKTQKAKLITIVFMQVLVCILHISYPVFRIFSLTYGFIFVISLVLMGCIIASRTVRKRAFKLSKILDENLSAREKKEDANRIVSKEFTNSLLSYDIHIAEFKLDINSKFCGKTLQQIGIRAISGVSVLRIVRGGMNINIPGGNAVLYPADLIVVAGSDDQISRFTAMIGESIDPSVRTASQKVNLERFPISDKSKLVGVSIANSGIREEAECIVMAVERDGNTIMTPNPNLQLKAGDIVIVAGETAKIYQFEKRKLINEDDGNQ